VTDLDPCIDKVGFSSHMSLRFTSLVT
jgi:hypothetical protein